MKKQQRYYPDDLPGDLSEKDPITLVECVEDYLQKMRRYPKVTRSCGDPYCTATWCSASELQKLTAIALVRKRRRR